MAEVITDKKVISSLEMNERALRAASGFAALGVDAGDRVALLLRNTPAFLEASLGLQHLGAYVVPINWHGSAHEILHVINDSKASALVAHRDLVRPDLARQIPKIPVITVADGQSEPGAQKEDPAAEWETWISSHSPHPEAPAPASESLIYTSGTTGLPKGVKRLAATPDQRKATLRMRELITGIGEDSRVLVTAPLYHTAPNMYALRAVRTAELLVLRAGAAPEETLELIEAHRITNFYTVPTVFSRMLALPETMRARYDTSSLRSILHAGGPCPASLKRAMIDWLGPVVTEYYGSTEHGPVTFVTSDEWLLNPGTVGRPITGVSLEILGEDGKPLPVLEPGEVFAVNDNYADFTYVNQPDARARLQHGRLVATGDIGYLNEDGYLYLCDRKRDLIISGGVNIYPAEIEAAIMEIDGIADCAVFGIPDAEFGESIMALVEPRHGSAIDPKAVSSRLEGRLGRYKKPRLIQICTALPRDESGKVRKRELRAPYWAELNKQI